MMQFHSWHQFWHMNGYGPYVWSAYALVAGSILVTTIRTWRAAKKVRRS